MTRRVCTVGWESWVVHTCSRPEGHAGSHVCSCGAAKPAAVAEAWAGELYGEYARWDSCVACQTREGAMLVFYVLSGQLVPGTQERPPERHTGANDVIPE